MHCEMVVVVLVGLYDGIVLLLDDLITKKYIGKKITKHTTTIIEIIIINFLVGGALE